MRTRFLQRPNRSEEPRADDARSDENKRSLEPTRKLRNALARLTALGMTIRGSVFFIVVSAAIPGAAMMQSRVIPPPAAQSLPTPIVAAPGSQQSPPPTPGPQP